MLREGSIFQTFMLTKLVHQTPVSELYQSIDVESGNRYLVKIARPDWLGSIKANYHAIDFGPGLAQKVFPSPSNILRSEVEFLQSLEGTDFGLPKVTASAESDDTYFCSFEFFDGVTLQEIIDNGLEVQPVSIAKAFTYVARLQAKGYFHGNLHPDNILVSKDNVLLLEPTFPSAIYDGPERHQLLSCITSPDYYPLLDPEQDHLALGLILYYLFTRRHPITAPPRLPAPPVRRTDPRLGAIIDLARERGANRFLSPLLNFINPSQVDARNEGAADALILRTLGFQRTGIGSENELLEVTPGSWLELRLDPEAVHIQNLWTLNRLGEAFVELIEERNRDDLEAAS